MSLVTVAASNPSKRPSNRKKRNGANRANPSPSAMAYRGPLRLPNGTTANDVVAVQIQLIGTIASSGAGVVATVFDAYSQASSSPDWSAYTGLYAEYRILSMEIEFAPWNKYNMPTSTALAPVYSVLERQTSTAIASLTEASSFESVKIHDPSTRFRRAIKMGGSGESDFTASTTSPNTDDRMFIKLYSSGNTVTTTLYDYLTRCIVQFRNRK